MELSAVQRFDAFLFVVARNLILDRLKKRAYEVTALVQQGDRLTSADDAEHLVRQHQCESLLQEIIQQLPPKQKEVYYLAREQGMSHKKIAEKMRLSPLTIKTHMAGALRSIRSYLQTHLPHILLIPVMIWALLNT